MGHCALEWDLRYLLLVITGLPVFWGLMISVSHLAQEAAQLCSEHCWCSDHFRGDLC